MRKMARFLLLTVAILILQTTAAWAAPSGGDAIWTKLAGKAALIGGGLKKTGFIIAGFGLIFFSFMAIFNKISWKNLAYIMLSCFVLTAMVGLINYFSQEGDTADLNDKFEGTGADASVTIEGGVPKAYGSNPSIDGK